MDAIPIFMAAIIFAAIMLTRTIIQNIPKNPADAVVDIGMERWHQQDLAEWDDEFEKAVGRRPFPPPNRVMGTWDQLLQPGLQNAFQQQNLAALQNMKGLEQQARYAGQQMQADMAYQHQQEIIDRMLGRARH